MTTLLEKVTTLLSANAHALVDQALKTNSLAVIDQYLRQAADNLASLDDATATVGGEIRTLDRRLAGQQQTAAELDQAVDAFLLRRDETAARSAQSRLNSAQTLIETYQQHRARLQAGARRCHLAGRAYARVAGSPSPPRPGQPGAPVGGRQ